MLLGGGQAVGKLIVDTFGVNEPVCFYAKIAEGDELGYNYPFSTHLSGLNKEGAKISAVKADFVGDDSENKNVVIGVAEGGKEGVEVFLVMQGEVIELQRKVKSDLGILRDNGELEQRVEDWVWNKERQAVLNDCLVGDYISKDEVLDAIAEIRGKVARLKASVILTYGVGRFGKSIAGVAFDAESGSLRVVDKSDPLLSKLVTKLDLDEEVRDRVRNEIIGKQLSDELTEKYGEDISIWPPEAILYPVVLDANVRGMIHIDSFDTYELSRLFGGEDLGIERSLERGGLLLFLSPKADSPVTVER